MAPRQIQNLFGDRGRVAYANATGNFLAGRRCRKSKGSQIRFTNQCQSRDDKEKGSLLDSLQRFATNCG